MTSLESLPHDIAAEPHLDRSVALLITTLADQIRATSNDQNIQKLARELKAIAPALVRAIACKPLASTTA